MKTLTIRLPDERYERLKQYAQSRRMSVNQLIEEFSALALGEFDAHIRYDAMIVGGKPQIGLEILDKLDEMAI